MFGGIPFEHFAGGGGFGGGGGRAPRGGPNGGGEPPETEKLYETLEVAKDASQKDIKKAYFRLSKQHHPDKGTFLLCGRTTFRRRRRRSEFMWWRKRGSVAPPSPPDCL